jgi:hypothetical protein
MQNNAEQNLIEEQTPEFSWFGGSEERSGMEAPPGWAVSEPDYMGRRFLARDALEGRGYRIDNILFNDYERVQDKYGIAAENLRQEAETLFGEGDFSSNLDKAVNLHDQISGLLSDSLRYQVTDDIPYEYKYLYNEVYLPYLINLEKTVKTEEDKQHLLKTFVPRISDHTNSDEIKSSGLIETVYNIAGSEAIPILFDRMYELEQEHCELTIQELEVMLQKALVDGHGKNNRVTTRSSDPVTFMPSRLRDPDYLRLRISRLKEQGVYGMPDEETLYFSDWSYPRPFDVVIDGAVEQADTFEQKMDVAKRLTNFMGFLVDDMEIQYEAAFMRLGTDVSLPVLLNNLNSENIHRRRLSARILQRMELGKIGVTEEGIEYLDKLYKLHFVDDPDKNLNSSDYFVRRITNDGRIGVFHEQRGAENPIVGTFNLQLESRQRGVLAKVTKLTSMELFPPRADETPQERALREEYTAQFVQHYEAILNDNILKDTGVKLNNLRLHEQGWLILYLLELRAKGNVPDTERFRAFVEEFGEPGLKSFLSLEYGGEGEDILEFAENPQLSEEQKLQIFKNFYSIANQAMTWRNIFDDLDAETTRFASEAHEAFIRDVAEFFTAAQIIAKGKGGDVTIGELLQNMSTIAYALNVLKGIYEDDSGLRLKQKPQVQNEYDGDGNLVESASSSFILVDESNSTRIAVFIRPKPTVRKGNIAEARINFKVTNLKTQETARIGFDLSDYGVEIGEPDKPAVVSLDIGVGKPDREGGVLPSQRVGRVLELVESSEGGHNELSFSPEMAERFPEIAQSFREYIESRFAG